MHKSKRLVSEQPVRATPMPVRPKSTRLLAKRLGKIAKSTVWSVQERERVAKAPVPMCFTREALRQVIRTVGTYPPETGAKGFGPKDALGFAVVEFDKAGSKRAGGAVYSPDVEWGEARRQYWLEQPDRKMMLWIGDIHSHPGNFGFPSAKSGPGLGDLGYVEEVFAQNEWMEYFFIPIVTGAGTEQVAIHPWVCQRGRKDPMLADILICPEHRFPDQVYSRSWLLSLEQEGITAEVNADPPAANDHLRAEYTSRLNGLISEAFHSKTILTVGVGAGSYAVEKLARLTPKKLKNCDPDVVEVSNLSRTAYSMADVGRRKVDALAARIKAVNPLVEVESLPTSILDLSPAALGEMMRGVDLIVAGTDSFAAQARVNELATHFQIPAVFIGIHAGGEGGRIIWFVPGETGCYRCVAPERYAAAEAGDPVDYSGMVGALPDCQFIDMIALKIVVALLERGQDSQYGRQYEFMRGRNEVIVRCTPEYEYGNRLWEALLADLPTEPKQFARELKAEAFLTLDSAWLRGPRDVRCPDCGHSAREEVASDKPRFC